MNLVIVIRNENKKSVKDGNGKVFAKILRPIRPGLILVSVVIKCLMQSMFPLNNFFTAYQVSVSNKFHAWLFDLCGFTQ